MVIQSHVTTTPDIFHFSALQLACLTLCILPYINRCSYEIYGALVWHWNLCFLFSQTNIEVEGKRLDTADRAELISVTEQDSNFCCTAVITCRVIPITHTQTHTHTHTPSQCPSPAWAERHWGSNNTIYVSNKGWFYVDRGGACYISQGEGSVWLKAQPKPPTPAGLIPPLAMWNSRWILG